MPEFNTHLHVIVGSIVTKSVPFNMIHRFYVCLSMHRSICVEKKNQLDATEWFIALIICSTCFGHFYAHHQELATMCVLLPPMVWDTLVAGGRKSDAGQQAIRPG